jgi:CheY-like chemotaxis protein
MNNIENNSDQLSNKTVLFVDDDISILKSIKRELRKEPYEKLFISNPYDVESLLENKMVHVIVTDMRMPGISGLDLLKSVKNNYPDIIRLVLSGYTQITTLLTAINSGEIYKYITKPWKANEELIDSVRGALKLYDIRKKKDIEIIDLENKIKVMNEKFLEEDKYDDNSNSHKRDYHLEIFFTFIKEFNEFMQFLLTDLKNNIDFKNDLIFKKIKPILTRMDYEHERIATFLEMLEKHHFIKKYKTNINLLFKKIIKKYEPHLKEFNINVNLQELSIIEISAKRRLLIFYLEDLLKRIIILGIANNADIFFKKMPNGIKVVIISLKLNYKFEKYQTDLQKLLGLHYSNYFTKMTNINIRTSKLNNKTNLILEFRE